MERQIVSLYDSYGDYKNYTTPAVEPKHIRRLDREVWQPAAFQVDPAVLEIGCGTGLFLAYLHAKGMQRFLGVDQDEMLRDVIPEAVRAHFQVDDAVAYIQAAGKSGIRYDRIVLFDVLEHFDVDAGRKLLIDLRGILAPAGRVVIKVPNAGSPWGRQF